MPFASPSQNRHAPAQAAILLALLTLLPACYPVTGGRGYCELTRNDPALPVETSKVVPMMRIGSLPHPFGPIPVRYGDHDDLGNHSIRHSAFRSIRLGEQSGGIIYTQRVGFIDLAHTRNTADLTWTCYQRIRPALDESRPRVLVAGAEPTLFLIHLDFPPGWDELGPDQRRALADAVALQLAVRMGYIVSTWHEVLTSFGFHGVTGIPEEQSAFAYDDQPSHLLGAVAAGEAIERVQTRGETWNQAMTAALEHLLYEFGGLDAAGTRRAVAASRGVWWDLEGPSRRQVHLGMAGETFQPLLIHHDHPEVLGDSPTPTNAADEPYTWQVPLPADLAQRDPALAPAIPSVRVAIDPNVSFSQKLYDLADTPGPWLDLDTHGPALKQHLENHLNPVPDP